MKSMKNQIKTLPLHRSKDQFITSTLYALGEKLDSTEWVNNECYFIFENAPSCEEIVKNYYADKLKISPRLLFNSFKDIKSMIFNN